MSLTKPAKVAIIMGSDSDFPVMKQAIPILQEHNVEFEVRIISAHRTPIEMVEYAQKVKERGFSVIIAGAGGAAHLPGMVASLTSLPVIGVPVRTTTMDGLDSMLSIQQMPGGIPVATVPINHASGAAELAVQMLQLNWMESNECIQVLTDDNAKTEELNVLETCLQSYGISMKVASISSVLPSCCNNNHSLFVIFNSLVSIDSELLSTVSEAGPVILVPTNPSVKHKFESAMDVVKLTGVEFHKNQNIGILAVNAFLNAGLMVARIVGIHDEGISNLMQEYQQGLRNMVKEKDAKFKVGDYPV